MYKDRQKAGSVLRKLKKESVYQNLSEVFKVLGDPTRNKIIHAVSLEQLCVSDVASLLHLSEATVSHHLRILRSRRVVKFQKKGKRVYYMLDDKHVDNLFREGLHHAEESTGR